MDIALAVALVAVAGTLLGSLVSGRAQQRAGLAAVAATATHDTRRAQLDSVTELADAISVHRRALWERQHARARSDYDPEGYTRLTAQCYATRAAVTRPLTALRVLIPDPDVRAAADHMVTVTYAIRDTEHTAAAADKARAEAVTAHDEFVTAAGRYLAQT
ncbi:hypothetical protein [Streptomyces sp. CAU 1734]|uniref:hypothetical protein n=1 Tax=Streptomyces sp. CAU 1734 TaxID=3140360 RepID=UPI0032618E44